MFGIEELGERLKEKHSIIVSLLTNRSSTSTQKISKKIQENMQNKRARQRNKIAFSSKSKRFIGKNLNEDNPGPGTYNLSRATTSRPKTNRKYKKTIISEIKSLKYKNPPSIGCPGKNDI